MAGTQARDETLWLRANALARKHGRDEVFVRTSPIGKVKSFIASLDGSSKSNAPVKKRSASGAVVKKRDVQAKGKKAGTKRSTATTATKRGPGRPRKSETAEAPKRRGRPPGSKNKPKAATKTATKRAPATAAKRRATAQSNSDTPGRSVVRNRLKWSAQGYNPREGTVANEVFQVVKREKGDREAAYKILVKRVKSLFPGHDLDKAKQMLRYRISRVIWDFAQATGQHEKSENRAEYGTAGTGAGVYERGKAGNRGRPPANGKPRKAARKSTGTRKAPTRGRTASARKTTRKRTTAKR
jgi:hypothetical protein